MNPRVEQVWQRLERWFESNLPPEPRNLGDPATPEELAELEQVIGFELPEDVKAVYLIHNGDGHPPGLFGNWERFLSVAEALEVWRLYCDLAGELEGKEDAFDHWRHQVEQGILDIKGPVKPRRGSPRWWPITDMNGDILRFLDFDPAPGGILGQVIEVDFESGRYQAVAASFVEFLEQYAASLEAGAFAVVDGDIERIVEDESDPSRWGVPDYLREVPMEVFAPGMSSDEIDPARLEEGEEVVIVGRMAELTGGPKTIFTLVTERGTRYSFLATREFTKGYGAISVGQHAWVLAERYTGQVESQLVTSGGVPAPQLLAKRYDMLISPDSH